MDVVNKSQIKVLKIKQLDIMSKLWLNNLEELVIASE